MIRYQTKYRDTIRYNTIRFASAFSLDTLGGRTAQRGGRRGGVLYADVPSGRAFQHNTAGVKRDFQQHTMQRM